MTDVKFPTGSIVLLSDRGAMYSSYERAAARLGLQNWRKHGYPADLVDREEESMWRDYYPTPFIVVGHLEWERGTRIYGVRHPDGTEYLMGERGLTLHDGSETGVHVC